MNIIKKIADWLIYSRTDRAIQAFSKVLNAAESGDVASVEKALKKMERVDFANDGSMEMLMYVAAGAGHKPIVDLLLNKGVPAEGNYMGMTYAETALQAGHLHIVNDLHAHVSSLGQMPSEKLTKAFNAAQQLTKPEPANRSNDPKPPEPPKPPKA